jgi:hypothetical protein
MSKMALCCVLLLAFAVLFVSPAFCYSEDEARVAVEAAESKILSCYNATFEAEKAGADVSGLLEVLNEAGWLLSEAKLAYNNEDFDLAYEYAVNCSQKLDEIAIQANSLKIEAEQAGYMDFLVNYVGSAVASVVVVVGGYAAWIFFKRREKGVEGVRA